MKTVAFTGYRLEKLPFSEDNRNPGYLEFRKKLQEVIEKLIERGYSNFISGMAVGFDTWAAEVVIESKKQNPIISLECAIPFPGQGKKWPLKDQSRRARIIKNADCFTTVCDHYSKTCFFLRNEYMVDKADIVVCCYDGQKGGTAQTVAYAKRKNKTILQINPNDAVISFIQGDKIFELT